MPQNDSDTASENRVETIRRRNVMKAVGATALGGAAFATPASACWEEIRFCGCGQVVVKVCEPIDLQNATITVTMYKEGKNGGVETDGPLTPSNEDFFRYVQKGNGKILGLEISHPHAALNGVFCNPNTCAEKVRDRESVSLSCDNDTADVEVGKGHCGPPNGGDE